METVQIGKRRTVTLPKEMRMRLGLEEGSLIVLDFKEGEIQLRPAFEYKSKDWAPERKAYFLLIQLHDKRRVG